MICLYLLARNVRTRPATDIIWPILFLLPWFAIQILASLHAGDPISAQGVLYPLLGVTVWVVSPQLQVLTTVGWLTILTAIGSVIFASLSPLGLFGAGIAGADKVIIGSDATLLAGPYPHPNQLGLVLALGSPFVFLIKSRLVRVFGMTIIGVAIAWCAARTSLLAFAVMLTLYGLTHAQTVNLRRKLFAAAFTVGCTLVIWTPLHESNPTAYSFRGQIWLASLSIWHSAKAFGAGPLFYSKSALGDYHFGAQAFHGHNLLVDTLTKAGYVGFAAIFAFVVFGLARRAWQLAAVSLVPALFSIVIIFTSWLEVPFSFGNLGFLGYTVWLPAAVLVMSGPEFLRGAHQDVRDGSPIALEPRDLHRAPVRDHVQPHVV
jgi:hypothetical protein